MACCCEHSNKLLSFLKVIVSLDRLSDHISFSNRTVLKEITVLFYYDRLQAYSWSMQR